MRFESMVRTMNLTKIETAGELNYLITQLTHAFVNQKLKKTYQNYNDAMGAMTGAQLEFYRRYVVPYENLKIVENGDVPEAK
jgi:hypothetical protein